jgi:signal transduction histidine kinase
LADKSVEVVFADSGKGIPDEHLHKIFDPFFSTKSATKGTGLGLAVSYGIIKKHGGEIDVASTVGKGTTFTVRMPIYG